MAGGITYQKRSYKKRGYKKKKYARKYKPSQYTTKFSTGLQRIGGLKAQPELKFIDQAIAAQPAAVIASDWAHINLAASEVFGLPDQNNTASTCIGRIYTIKSMQISFQFQRVREDDSGVVPEGANIQYAIVVDKQTNGVKAGASEMYQNGTPGGLFRNMQNTDRFTVLKNGSVYFPPGIPGAATANDYPDVNKVVNCFIKPNMRVQRALGTGKTYAAVKDMSVHIIWKTDVTSSGANLYTATVNCRTRFIG